MQVWSHSQADRFQRDWTLSEVVHEILRLRPHDDVEGLLNHWIGCFARKNFPLLIRYSKNQVFP
ncbi:pentatricopeptide repeat-containing protein [Quercus suber]|uniref:Pentatricopeptide repeat-containing protein n=1 Tax=Quercus suber TaxID=58331 RepID=A0AAW0IM65_QUESU